MMDEADPIEEQNLAIARDFCAERGWKLLDTAGRGGTAPVFTVEAPDGRYALKLYDEEFSSGERGEESERRIKLQVDELGLHDCPHIVRVHDGGRFGERLFVLMDKAPGTELEKKLQEVPRDKIRLIVDQVARAAIFLRERGLCHRDIKSANIFISDDFNTATLLDLSVLRSVDDPIGLGTDHGNQLPVVATSRYSPPEYLFRLIEAGRDLWHALDIYQLGGLLHDLIMQEPMFETEYRISKDSNRYRFAWIVATQDPAVAASDVDQDLVQLARRALDKDWERRSALRLDDFLNEDRVRREHALEALGGRARDRAASVKPNPTRELEAAAHDIDEFIRAALSAEGITVVHAVEKTGKANSRKVAFRWGQDRAASSNVLSRVEFAVTLSVVSQTGGMALSSILNLRATLEGQPKETDLELPDQKIGPDAAVAIGSAAAAALPGMAARLLEAD